MLFGVEMRYMTHLTLAYPVLHFGTSVRNSIWDGQDFSKFAHLFGLRGDVKYSSKSRYFLIGISGSPLNCLALSSTSIPLEEFFQFPVSMTDGDRISLSEPASRSLGWRSDIHRVKTLVLRRVPAKG